MILEKLRNCSYLDGRLENSVLWLRQRNNIYKKSLSGSNNFFMVVKKVKQVYVMQTWGIEVGFYFAITYIRISKSANTVCQPNLCLHISFTQEPIKD